MAPSPSIIWKVKGDLPPLFPKCSQHPSEKAASREWRGKGIWGKTLGQTICVSVGRWRNHSHFLLCKMRDHHNPHYVLSWYTRISSQPHSKGSSSRQGFWHSSSSQQICWGGTGICVSTQGLCRLQFTFLILCNVKLICVHLFRKNTENWELYNEKHGQFQWIYGQFLP